MSKEKYIPSGDWEGYYIDSAQKTHQKLKLFFKNNTVSGSGIDAVGNSIWKGTYSLETMKCELVKKYATHEVLYNGDIDENGIWGNWFITQNFLGGTYQASDGFHIWPIKSDENRASIKAVAEQKKVKKKHLVGA